VRKGGTPVSPLAPPHPTTNVIAERDHNSLIVHSWIGDKPCLVTTDTGASMTITKPDITSGLPERDPPMQCTLQTASGKTLPILKEAFIKLTLGWHPLTTWVFITNITDEFIL
jgi:hypothetical protein